MRLASLFFACLLAAPPGSAELVDGLWRYRTIGREGTPETAIDGLFLFCDGRFVQQSLNAGDPPERQLAQAHAGTFRLEGDRLRLTAEIGLVIDPTKTPAVAARNNSEHAVAPTRAGDRLTLTFGTGTIQRFERVGPGCGELFVLEDGALALVDGHFLLVVQRGDRSVAGSGRFERCGRTVKVRPDRWVSIEKAIHSYAMPAGRELTLETGAVRLPDGAIFAIKQVIRSALRPGDVARNVRPAVD